jgi:hypothetical protein
MANMVHMNEAKTDMSELKDAIHEWFEALTSELARAAIFHPATQVHQNPQPCASSPAHLQDTVFGPLLGRLLLAGGLTLAAVYVAQSVDWTNVGIDLLLKATSLL